MNKGATMLWQVWRKIPNGESSRKHALAEKWKAPIPWMMLNQTWCKWVFCEVVIGISYFQLPFASFLLPKAGIILIDRNPGEGKCRHGFLMPIFKGKDYVAE